MIQHTPFLLETTIVSFDQQNRREIAEYAVDQFNEKDTPGRGGYNVHLDKTPDLDKLWRIFMRLCDTYFTNLDVIYDDKYSEAWAYVQNKERYSSVWHSHISSASINAVYYASVPDSTGTLSLLFPDGQEYELDAVEGNMIIFPGWLIHKPNPQKNSMIPRVSINIELLTSSRPILKDYKGSYDVGKFGAPLEGAMW